MSTLTPQSPEVITFFDSATSTATHLVIDPSTNKCAVIDSVLDYDHKSGSTSTESISELTTLIADRSLKLEWILETHVHAEHLSAAPLLQSRFGGKVAIGKGITEVQGKLSDLFNAQDTLRSNGSQFDVLLGDNSQFFIGNIDSRAIQTPGHTPSCMTFVIGDAAFVGDTLFMPDCGTARCDFPSGCSTTLYQSIQKIYALPEDTRVFVCHDYPPNGRPSYQWQTTIAEQKQHNIHIHQGISQDAFVTLRDNRDATLPLPSLMLPSIQVNMRAGKMPPAEDNGQVYLKIPMNVFNSLSE